MKDKATGGKPEGWIASKEFRKRSLEINSGSNSYWYDKPWHMEYMRSKITKRFDGHKHSEESKKKMSESRTGKKRSKETRQKISKSLKGNPKLSATVSRRNKKPLEIDGIKYNSLDDASKALNISTPTIRKRANSDNYPNYKFLQKGVETIEIISLTNDKRE